ncbi:hypothetical protein N7451_012551 [Penicillium sp. IBT 35674x]|nr:hypothetical protein N7451_012551 [Penicillium sp. IBT 35674x]
MLFISLIIYVIELCLIKLSLLFFYRRVFGMNRLNQLATFLVISWTIGSLIAILTGPDPISYFWNETLQHSNGRYRYDFYHYYIGNAVSNVACDLIVIAVPIPIVWRLKMRVTQKVAVSLVLLLGCFVLAASIIRIHYLTRLRGEGLIDITWTMAPVSLWSTIEPCISVIAACLLAMKPVVQCALQLERNMQSQVKLPQEIAKAQSQAGIRQQPLPSDLPNDIEQNSMVRLFPSVARVESHRANFSQLEEYLGPYYMEVTYEYDIKVERIMPQECP